MTARPLRRPLLREFTCRDVGVVRVLREGRVFSTRRARCCRAVADRRGSFCEVGMTALMAALVVKAASTRCCRCAAVRTTPRRDASWLCAAPMLACGNTQGRGRRPCDSMRFPGIDLMNARAGGRLVPACCAQLSVALARVQWPSPNVPSTESTYTARTARTALCECVFGFTSVLLLGLGVGCLISRVALAQVVTRTHIT